MKKRKHLLLSTFIASVVFVSALFNGAIPASAQANIDGEFESSNENEDTNVDEAEYPYEVIYEESEGENARFMAGTDSKTNRMVKNQAACNQESVNQAHINKTAGLSSGVIVGSITPTETGFIIGIVNPGGTIGSARLRLTISSVTGKVLKRTAKQIRSIPNGTSTHTWTIPKTDTVQEQVELNGTIGAYKINTTTTKRYNFVGGKYSSIKPLDGERHHMPSKAAAKSMVSYTIGPAIRMVKGDHTRTASWGKSSAAATFRANEQKLVKSGSFLAAQKLGIKDVQSKFGTKYNKAINQMVAYTKTLGFKR